MATQLYKNIRKRATKTQDYVPIKDIKNGIVITEDDRYISITELLPVNLEMKSREEIKIFLRDYMAWQKTAPKSYMIKCITKRADVNAYTKSTKEAIDKEDKEGVKAIGSNYINFLNSISRTLSVERHFYFIFEYESDNTFFSNLTEDEKIEELIAKTEKYKMDFRRFGNLSVSTYAPDVETCKFLYDFYNKDILEEHDYFERVSRIANDTALVNQEKNIYTLEPSVKDLIAPISIDSTPKDYMVINGAYCSYMYVNGNSIPERIGERGWVTRLIELEYGIDVDLLFRKRGVSEMLRFMKRKKKLSRLKLSDRKEDSNDIMSIEKNLDAIEAMRTLLTEYNEEPYDISVLLTVHANTKEELYRKKALIMEQALKMQIEIGEANHFQEDGYISTFPLNKMTQKTFKYSKRNATTSAVAAMYPYTSYSLADKEGIAMGVHQYNQSLIMYNNFDSEKYPNPNLTIFGRTGAGKTYALLTITTRFRIMGVPIFIIAPDKQDEFLRISSQCDGIFVDLSAGGKERINPLDIFPIDSAANEAINKRRTDRSWLRDKINRLQTWFAFSLPGLSQAQKALIEIALTKTYAKKGITDDNDSIYINKEKKIKKEMPILSDLIRTLEQTEGLDKDVLTIMSRYEYGNGRNLNGQTNIDLDNKYIVFGIENLEGEMKAPIMFLALEVIWSKVRMDRTQKKIIALDEGWKLNDKDNPQIGDFVIEIFKMIRGFGGGAIFATQSPADLLQGENSFGNAILSCSHSNIILGLEKKDIEKIKETLALSEEDISPIPSFSRGMCLLCAGANHIPMIIRASQLEHYLYTTDRKDLEQIAKAYNNDKEK